MRLSVGQGGRPDLSGCGVPPSEENSRLLLASLILGVDIDYSDTKAPSVALMLVSRRNQFVLIVAAEPSQVQSGR